MSKANEETIKNELSDCVNRLVMRFAPLAMIFHRDFQPGQRYIFRDDVKRGKNPFAKDEKPFIVEIIAAKDGWVNYKHVGSIMWQNESMERGSFNFCYMLLDA